MTVVQDSYDVADRIVVQVELPCGFMIKDCHVMYLRFCQISVMLNLTATFYYSERRLFEKVVMYGKISKMLSGILRGMNRPGKCM